jgi:hypothetical protein
LPDWPFPCVGVLSFIAAVVMIAGKYRWGWQKPNWPVPLTFCFLGIVSFYVAGPLVRVIAQMNSEALTAFETGKYSVAEGVVTDFHPMPYEGHDDECFSVSGRRFCYSDYMETPGFHNASSHGGPIHAGLQLRVSYSFGSILKLEVPRDQALSHAQLAQQAKMQGDPVEQRVSLGFQFTAVCWTLWWNLQWRRAMRYWLRPPNRPITQHAFRVFFGLCFFGALWDFAQQLRNHPLTAQNAGPTVATAVIISFVVALGVWWTERRDRENI